MTIFFLILVFDRGEFQRFYSSALYISALVSFSYSLTGFIDYFLCTYFAKQ